MSVGKAYSFRDGWLGRMRSEHANPRHDALVDWNGIVILAVGSNYSVDLSAGTEATAALYSVSLPLSIKIMSGDAERDRNKRIEKQPASRRLRQLQRE